MAILVPPAVFDKVQPILDAPMASNQPHQPFRAHLVRRQAGDQVAGFLTGRGSRDADLEVDPQVQLDTGESGRLSDVINLVAVEDPELAGMDLAPFFSLVSTSAGWATTS